MDTTTSTVPARAARSGPAKVPRPSGWFWALVVLCSSVGQSAAEWLVSHWGPRTGAVSVAGALVVAFAVQLAIRSYVPAVFWSLVGLVSVSGPLVTDALTDAGVTLWLVTGTSMVAFGVTFGVLFASERGASWFAAHRRRVEVLYWFTALVAIIVGSALGDLLAEELKFGYSVSAALFAAMVATVATAWWKLDLGATIAFWCAFIISRPLGESLGDFVRESPQNGGLGIGSAGTAAAFLVTIVALVTFISVSKVDRVDGGPKSRHPGRAA